MVAVFVTSQVTAIVYFLRFDSNKSTFVGLLLWKRNKWASIFKVKYFEDFCDGAVRVVHWYDIVATALYTKQWRVRQTEMRLPIHYPSASSSHFSHIWPTNFGYFNHFPLVFSYPLSFLDGNLRANFFSTSRWNRCHFGTRQGLNNSVHPRSPPLPKKGRRPAREIRSSGLGCMLYDP